MKEQHYHQSFYLKTNKGEYDVKFEDMIRGDERWSVSISYHGKTVTGNFSLPKDWGRTMVFQFVDSIDQNVI